MVLRSPDRTLAVALFAGAAALAAAHVPAHQRADAAAVAGGAVGRADPADHLGRGVDGGAIYRVGILMYGKRPTLPEILRWVRAS
jgi:hypothetical protein